MTLESTDTIPNEIITTPIKFYMVASAIDDGLYGPFTTYCDAVASAEPADGSVFDCSARLVDVREV
jgi:hypothetical protein